MKHSNMRFFIEYVIIAFSAYLITSALISIIGEYPYRQILCSPGQVVGILFLYWWVPVPRMCDLEDANQNWR